MSPGAPPDNGALRSAAPGAATVSVVVTVFNEEASLAALLDCLLSQTLVPDEVVVVDGGSSDATCRILAGYAGGGSPVRCFVEPGVNIARGRNLGIWRAAGSIVAVTDGGCRPEPTWLAELVRPLLEDPSIGAVSGVRRIDARTPFERYSGLLSTSRDSGDEQTRLFFGRSSAFRKSVALAVGGYPEWLYTAEDTLFALRAKALGCRVAHAELSVVDWRPRPTLRKLAKQFFLYGRGNGRIQLGDIDASLYHLRNHLLWMAALLAGLVFPWCLLVCVTLLGYLYRILVLPVLRPIRQETPDPWREWYVPVIVMTRSLCHNLGFLVGSLEYRFREPFRKNLEMFNAGVPVGGQGP